MPNTIARVLCLLLSVPLLGACRPKGCGTSQTTRPVVQSETRQEGRLVVLGFDGVDPRWVRRWVDEGRLPNMKRLMERAGAYRPLGTTNPPQSPVAWSTFATGTLPGDHGIFDFISRKIVRGAGGLPVLPEVATTSFRSVVGGPPIARNLRTGEPFWKALADKGVRVVALNVPYSFPPDPMRSGRMLSGLGTPDLRETNSTFTYAGVDVTPNDAQPGGGVLVPLTEASASSARFKLDGPSIPGTPDRMQIPVTLTPHAGGGIDVDFGGAKVFAPERDFSQWVSITFETGEGAQKVAVRGIVRAATIESFPRPRLFVSPINFHPEAPYSPFTFPNSFATELMRDVGGLYKNVGWDHDTSALNSERIDDALFLRDVALTEDARLAMLEAKLSANDWDALVWVSTATDRVAHMFYRLIDPEHPRYDAALAAQHGNAIRDTYERMDRTIGKVLAKLGPKDALLVMSDHGFHNYRRGVHVNQWLRENGLLFLKNDAVASDFEFLREVDWSRTKAYALGTGQVYFNLRGRERDGIVNREEVAALTAQIRDGLRALTDVDRAGVKPIHDVHVGATVFAGGRQADAPDLQIAFAENYRTSWETILGGIPAGVFADNTKKWSGDHAASEAAETPGIILSNRPVREGAHIVDFAPTALTWFGIERPSRYVGHNLFGAR